MREDRRVTCPNCGSLAFVRTIQEGFDPLDNDIFIRIYRCDGCETEWSNSWRVEFIDTTILLANKLENKNIDFL